MKLDTHRDVLDVLSGLDAKHYKQVARKMLGLMADPHPPDSQALRGYDDLLRADIGEFRIIYRIDDNTVYIDVIGRRNDDAAYRKMERRG